MGKRDGSELSGSYWRAYRPFLLTLASGLGIVLSFYPFGLDWMGWLTPLGVLWLISDERAYQEDLKTGLRMKTQIWLACFVCWLVLFQCVRLPHWAGYIGWPILAAYLGSYLFFFVVMCRYAVQQIRVPILVAAPILWIGFEYIQAHACTGISLGMLSHTQAHHPLVIQAADLFGCYAVSFLMVAIVSGLFVFFSRFVADKLFSNRMRMAGLIQAIVLIGFMLGYGIYRMQEADRLSTKQDFRVAIIQGSIDTRFPDESEYREYLESFRKQYTELSLEACKKDVDLVVWPESMFPELDVFDFGGKRLEPPPLIKSHAEYISMAAHLVTGAAVFEQSSGGMKYRRLKDAVPLLVGASSQSIDEDREGFYNSALMISEKGKIVGRYGKMKLVIFGEFVPLGDRFPWLYNYFPIPPGLKAWQWPETLRTSSGYGFCPSICFESTYPHLIRENHNYLKKRGERPNVLVNLSNDGWFYGSTALDLHFANNVFRAVENRLPMLIAANTGFSGQIDSAGRILQKGPRHETAVIVVNLITTKQRSIYHRVGDWPVFFCFLAVLVVFLHLIWRAYFKWRLELESR